MKDEQVVELVDWFNKLKLKYSIDVKYIHCDNGGENSPTATIKEDGSKIQFEFTAPDMCQKNGIVECEFPALMVCTRAMMNYTEFNKNM